MASKFGGYMGEAIWVDVGKREVRPYDISDEDRVLFFGNKGMAAKILWDNLKPGIDPLGPENIMVIATAPITGTGAPCSARFNISTKGPLTGGILSANTGGSFGVFLKRAGFDVMILAGRSDTPVYLEVNEGQVVFHDAAELWGLDTEVTQEKLLAKHGKKISAIVIGPAGENLVRYACIINGERALGRGGIGTVMGSKNIKGVFATGSRKPRMPEGDEYKEFIKKWIEYLKGHPATGETLPKFGTMNHFAKCNVLGVLPTRNFQAGTFEFSDEIDGEALAEKYLVRNSGCLACPIRCERRVKVGEKEVKGPEYETVGMMGAAYGNRDLRAICDWNYLADKLGMDTISVASTINCAVELTEKGLLKSDLKWGKTEGYEELLHQIARREGLGDDLAEGSMRLAEKYGGPQYAMHSKGMELAAYEPRRSAGMGLGYATASRGGCHLEAGYMIYFENLGPINIDPLSTRGKAGLTIFQQNALDAISVVGSCIFTSYGVIPPIAKKVKPYGVTAKILDIVLRGTGDLMPPLLKIPMPIQLPLIPHSKAASIVTGMRMNLGDFLKLGERIFNLERMFNVREGLVIDTLPDRLLKEPQSPDNPQTVVPLNVLLPRYYKCRGWDERGLPKPKTLKALHLDFTAGVLPATGKTTKEMYDHFVAVRREYEVRQAVQIKKQTSVNGKAAKKN